MTAVLSRVLFWSLLPVSAVQGLWLRRVARRLPGAPGERCGSSGGSEPLHLLAIGDSIIDGVGIDCMERALPAQFALALARESGRDVRWRVEGQSGRNISDLLERLHELEPALRADMVLVSIGVNDVTGLSSLRHWRQQLATFLQELETRWPGVRIVFAGLPPMSHFPLPPQPLRFSLGLRASALDGIAKELVAGQPNAIHVPTTINPETNPFCEDGFHPAAESCTLWARELAANLSGGNQDEHCW